MMESRVQAVVFDVLVLAQKVLHLFLVLFVRLYLVPRLFLLIVPSSVSTATFLAFLPALLLVVVLFVVFLFVSIVVLILVIVVAAFLTLLLIFIIVIVLIVILVVVFIFLSSALLVIIWNEE